MLASLRPRVAVSSCLLGNRVRYDGAEKRVAWIAESLPQLAELLPMCPEVEAGMGVPRPPIRIVRSKYGDGLRRVGTELDETERMQNAIARLSRVLRETPVDGFIFKARSPSCGPEVDVFASGSASSPVARGQGLWFRAVTSAFPDLPICDEGELEDPERREQFLRAVVAHCRQR